jgi:hypothetical protein
MGTRSLTHIKQDNKTILTIYRQYDGYPDGMGLDLAKFLVNIQVVNGFGPDMEAGSYANGMGCLAAQLVAHLKTGIGNVYIMTPDTSDVWEEYTYKIKLGEEGLLMKYNNTKYYTPKEFIKKFA